MKYLIAIVKPNRAQEVRHALSEVGAKGMTLTETIGFGQQKGHTEIHRGTGYLVETVRVRTGESGTAAL